MEIFDFSMIRGICVVTNPSFLVDICLLVIPSISPKVVDFDTSVDSIEGSVVVNDVSVTDFILLGVVLSSEPLV